MTPDPEIRRQTCESLSATLSARLRKETNGAAADDMNARGLCYKVSYGVALHTIRRTTRDMTEAMEMSPVIRHEFAKYLWRQPIRELRLAATVIADPQYITSYELKFWFDGVANTELAENLAMLLGKTSHSAQIAELYGRSENHLIAYAALLATAHGNTDTISAETIIGCVENAISRKDMKLIRAAGLLLTKASGSAAKASWGMTEETETETEAAAIKNYISSLSESGDKNRMTLFDEIMT